MDYGYLISGTVVLKHMIYQSSKLQTRAERIILSADITYEPAHETTALFVLCKFTPQPRTHSYQVRTDVRPLVGSHVYFHISCVRTARAPAKLCGCAGSPEPPLVAYVISTIISRVGRKEDCIFVIYSKSWFLKLPDKGMEILVLGVCK